MMRTANVHMYVAAGDVLDSVIISSSSRLVTRTHMKPISMPCLDILSQIEKFRAGLYIMHGGGLHF
jgi:hypothetical protein